MRKSKKILVIDDEPDFHSLFSRILEEEGYLVTSVYSGEEALGRMALENFDLIILDLVLPPPQKSGIEILEEIRKINTETCIIITSAYATVEQAVEAVMEKGAQTYIRKPFNIENVKQIVKNGLRWRKPLLHSSDHNVNMAIELRRQSIMKRCFITGSPHCPWKIQENFNSVFVAMPFIDTEEHFFNEVYQNGIKPAISHLNLEIWRADENMNNVVIMCKICQGIQKSRYAIIDISDWNVNVLFEFGLLYGLGKRTVVIKNKISELPTNLRGMEYIGYDNDYDKLKTNIIEHLGNMIEKSLPQKDRS